MAVPALPSGYALQEYRIERLLGAGGFGLTYLAIDTNLNLRVAIKEYLPSDIAIRNPDHSVAPNSSPVAEDFMWGKRRFLDESRTIASFRHPNIVRVMRFFEAKGSAYMVMEYVEGDALPDWIKPRRPLPEAQVMAIAGPLLEGLQVVHNAGYLHRDIKPGNIYIRYDGSPVLLDFGSARQSSDGDALTAIVTPGYAPFEQDRAAVVADVDVARLDVAVQVARVVDHLQPLEERAGDRHDLRLRQRPARLDPVGQGVALDVLHDHVRAALGLEEAHHPDDVRMAERGDGARFVEEAALAPHEILGDRRGVRRDGVIGVPDRDVGGQVFLDRHPQVEVRVDGK